MGGNCSITEKAVSVQRGGDLNLVCRKKKDVNEKLSILVSGIWKWRPAGITGPGSGPQALLSGLKKYLGGGESYEKGSKNDHSKEGWESISGIPTAKNDA